MSPPKFRRFNREIDAVPSCKGWPEARSFLDVIICTAYFDVSRRTPDWYLVLVLNIGIVQMLIHFNAILTNFTAF